MQLAAGNWQLAGETNPVHRIVFACLELRAASCQRYFPTPYVLDLERRYLDAIHGCFYL